LIKFENKETNWDNLKKLIYLNKRELMYDCDMLEIFCRALRDKLENA
jgi:hypothetical protein